jgi:hypothetical protein
VGLPVRRTGSRALKETAFGLGSGNLALNSEFQHELVLIEWECQGQSKDSFVEKNAGNSDSPYPRQKHRGFGGGIEKNFPCGNL